MTSDRLVLETTYDHALSSVHGWWRGVLAIVVLVVATLAAALLLGGAAATIDILTGAVTPEQIDSGAIPITPLTLLATNLSLAILIPVSMGLQRWFFGVRGRHLLSVEGRFRWRWFGRLALVIVPVWALYVLGALLLAPGTIRLDGTAIALLAIVLLTTPLQAAGEEFGFRGIAQRSAGSWLRSPGAAFAVSTVVSAAVFGAFHFATDPWLIAYYFLFGVAMSIAARGSGGLEAAVLVHTTNNVLLLIPAALTGALDEGIDRSEGAGGPIMLVPMIVVLLAGVFAGWYAKRRGVRRTAPPPVTVAQERAAARPAPVTETAG